MNRSLVPRILFLPLLAALLQAAPIGFNRDVRPILSENCYPCHGPDKNARQAGLRLDRREEAVARGAIDPGKPGASKLAARIQAKQDALRMPPVWSDKKLTDEQKTTLLEWVSQGAEYESHWAYIPPVRSEAPAGPAAIDHFINEKLNAKALAPVEEAGRRTLARRLSFDLLGLPPPPDVVEEFVEDKDPGAYGKLLDGFLASPHFGERMAVHWLDLVRYADTVGFHGDVAVNVYPFRDYVIRAFNDNKPFDEFTREQLGGDLIPGATIEQQVASAYNRLSRMTNEGGAQAKEYLAKYAADRARTASTVWLGSTMGCAECHDHKFDPFWTKDFYALQAFFADIEEDGVFQGYGDWGSKIQVPSAEAQEEIASIDARIADLRGAGENELPPADENLRQFAAQMRESLKSWMPLRPSTVSSDCSDPNVDECEKIELRVETAGAVHLSFASNSVPLTAAQQAEIPLTPGRITALLIEVFEAELSMKFFLAEFQVRLVRDGQPARRIGIQSFVPDWEAPGSMLRKTVDDNHHTGWSGDPCEEGTRRAAFVLDEALEVSDGDRLVVTTIYDRNFGLTGFALRQRLWSTDSAFPEVPPRDELRSAFQQPLTASRRSALAEVFESTTRRNGNWEQIRQLERRKKTLIDNADETLISKSVEPREIRVLPRGNWMDTSGEVVEPRAPHFLKQIPVRGKRLTRLDLGNWLTDRENPLTARVFVNRLWKLFFGTGISKILDDIGSQGETPVNQELLDWLAAEFMDSGWDVKHIIRTMLESETYRRSSEPSAALLESDPYNRLHGRQTARRLDAEFIRDNALAVSGLLNRRIGGRSAKPYQPPGYYEELNFPKRIYHPDLNENQFRRGLYTHWQRTYLHPSMMAFDAPTREECTAERSISNTPLQSLALLNDPTYVEAARAFAVRVLGFAAIEPSSTTQAADRIRFAFQQAFSREPDPSESELLLNLLDRQRNYFAAKPSAAAALINTGMSKVPAELDATEIAAWTMLTRALLNKHEFVMRY